MKYTVNYSPRSIEDLEEIYNSVIIMSGDIKTAENYIREIDEKINSRSTFPEANSPLNYNDVFTGYYFIPFKSHLIFLMIEDKKIIVVRILHKRCNYIEKLNLK